MSDKTFGCQCEGCLTTNPHAGSPDWVGFVSNPYLAKIGYYPNLTGRRCRFSQVPLYLPFVFVEGRGRFAEATYCTLHRGETIDTYKHDKNGKLQLMGYFSWNAMRREEWYADWCSSDPWVEMIDPE